MLEIAARRVGDDPRVRFLRADLFEWSPDRKWDVAFFGFWISHVPLERFDAFWKMVGESLRTGGRVFFVDDAFRTPDELIEGEQSSTIERRLEDGTAFRAVKVPHSAPELEAKIRRLGWDMEVHPTAGPFYWGSGSPKPR